MIAALCEYTPRVVLDLVLQSTWRSGSFFVKMFQFLNTEYILKVLKHIVPATKYFGGHIWPRAHWFENSSVLDGLSVLHRPWKLEMTLSMILSLTNSFYFKDLFI